MSTNTQEINIEYQTRKKQNKNILIAILGTLFLVTGLAIGILLVRQNQQIKEKAATITGNPKVFLSPETKTVQEGQTFSVNILLDTSGRYISAITLNLNYSYNEDAPPIVATDIQINSDLVVNNDWSFPIKSVNNNTQDKVVEIRIGGLNSSSQGYKTNGEQVIATINFKAESGGSINLTFNPVTTKITDKSTSEDIALTPSSSGSYLSKSETPQNTITPTPDPTTTPNLSPTASASASATPIKTKNPIPIVTPTPSLPPTPESGTSFPTVLGIIVGTILLTSAIAITF